MFGGSFGISQGFGAGGNNYGGFEQPQPEAGTIAPSQGLAGFMQEDGKPQETPGGAKAVAHTLTPVTIRMLQEGVKERRGNMGPDEFIRVNGAELHMLTLVACVEGTQMQQLGMAVTLNDGTGRMECQMYADADSVSNGPEFQVGDYIRVYGHLRNWNDEDRITAHRIAKIENPNEIAHHTIEVAHVHLSRTGKLVKAAGQAAPLQTGKQAQAGQMHPPTHGQMQAPAGQMHPPTHGQMQAPAGQMHPPTHGQMQAPAGQMQAPAGQMQAQAGQMQAPAGQMQAPAGQMHPPTHGQMQAQAGQMNVQQMQAQRMPMQGQSQAPPMQAQAAPMQAQAPSMQMQTAPMHPQAVQNQAQAMPMQAQAMPNQHHGQTWLAGQTPLQQAQAMPLQAQGMGMTTPQSNTGPCGPQFSAPAGAGGMTSPSPFSGGQPNFAAGPPPGGAGGSHFGGNNLYGNAPYR